jgi:hypothetical protein
VGPTRAVDAIAYYLVGAPECMKGAMIEMEQVGGSAAVTRPDGCPTPRCRTHRSSAGSS